MDTESRDAAVTVELSLSSVAAAPGDNTGGGLCGGDTAEFVSVLELLPWGVAGASLEVSSSLLALLESCRKSCCGSLVLCEESQEKPQD